MSYTVDEVSEVLEIPRPTLYRYLREYSIPHERRSGKISIPQESLERIREARELHREGLGTTSVRERMKQTGPNDTEGLAERLDRLCGALENLQDNFKPADDASSSRVLREILEGQRSLTLAVHRLSERVEEGLATDGHSSRSPYSTDPEEEDRGRRHSLDESERRAPPTEDGPDVSDYEADTTSALVEHPKTRARRKARFGDMSRRRRRSGALSLLLALLLGGISIWGLAAWDYPEEEGTQANLVEQASSSEQVSSDEPEAGDQEQSLTTAEAAEAVEVPNLIGLTFPQARDELAQAGLEPGRRSEVKSIYIPTGTVISQYPSSGEAMEPGSNVDLVLSSGPPMPDAPGNETVPPPPEVPGGAVGAGSDALPYQDVPYQDGGIPPEPF